jgi:hypothetical protein
MVWPVAHLGTSVHPVLDILTELHRYGVKLVVHDYAGDCATVETGGLPAAADLVVDARPQYRARNPCRPNSRPPVASGFRVALQFEQVVRQAPRNSGIGSTKLSRIQVCYAARRADYQFLANIGGEFVLGRCSGLHWLLAHSSLMGRVYVCQDSHGDDDRG